MALSTAIAAILESNASLVSVMAGRMYPDVLPQKYALPAISFTVDNITVTEHKDGATGWDEAFITIRVFSVTRTDCETYAGYVVDTFTRVTGVFGGETLQTGNHQGESWIFDIDMTQPGDSKMGQGVCIHEINFKIVSK